jgi:hypothetical protein
VAVTRLPAGTGEVEVCFSTATGSKAKPAGRVPPDALLFASRQKVSKYHAGYLINVVALK